MGGIRIGRLTTCLLDTVHGKPGAVMDMVVTLYRRAGERYETIESVTTNADGAHVM
jgi:5-hydroxyisourate hydrolase-like protein (transthyretin family)